MTAPLPVFTTQRLQIREITMEDAPSYADHFIDYKVIRYLSTRVPWPYPSNGVETFFKQTILPEQGRTRWTWGLFLNTDPNTCIGAIELFRDGQPENRGFWLSSKHHSQGLMTEALTPITNYAFDALGFRRLIFTNAVGNVRSRKIKERSGAQLLYTEPASFVDPEFTQHEVWELLPEAWKAAQTP